MDAALAAEDVRASASRPAFQGLLTATDFVAALTLTIDLVVIVGSVVARSMFNAPVEWADDIARGLMVASSFFGAASAVARSESLGVDFFLQLLSSSVRRVVLAIGSLLVVVISGYVSWNALHLGWMT